MKPIDYPIRINRYLYLKGYCSRRKADSFIEKGFVTINGKRAEVGAKVFAHDKVVVAKEMTALPRSYKYFMYNKPVGIVSHNPQKDEEGVEDVSGLSKDFVSVGRLDKASHGLMLLSNDGRIVDRMLNPKFEHEKEYIVKVDKRVTGTFVNGMSRGVHIEGYRTKPAIVKKTGERTFTIILTEGKKHQIRRMVAAFGYQVLDLKRTRIMSIKLGALKEGATRELSEGQRKKLLDVLNVENPIST
ncbi:MAG: rRNA pseudouridine synthase [Candidatus Pacebacteria bacterium]|nr:rRNA pseudouridine synthase [Candidatus Paceibacterota bacterium]